MLPLGSYVFDPNALPHGAVARVHAYPRRPRCPDEVRLFDGSIAWRAPAGSLVPLACATWEEALATGTELRAIYSAQPGLT